MANNPYNLPGSANSIGNFSIPGWFFEFRRNGGNIWVRATRTDNNPGYAFCGFTFQRLSPLPMTLTGTFGLTGANVFNDGSAYCTAYLPGVSGQTNTLRFAAGMAPALSGEKTVFPYIN